MGHYSNNWQISLDPGDKVHTINKETFTFDQLIVNTNRQKRSPYNPLGIITHIKEFVSHANSLSWDQFYHNFGTNVKYGIEKISRVSNHFTCKFR